MNRLDTYEELLEYFQKEHAISPDDQRWIDAIVTLDLWKKMIQAPSIMDDELLAMIEMVHTYKDKSSGWFALALLINNWINENAISAPTIFSWNPR